MILRGGSVPWNQKTWDAMDLTPLQHAWVKGQKKKESAITLGLPGVHGGTAKAATRVFYLGNKWRNYSQQKHGEFSILANLMITLLGHLPNVFANSLGLFISHMLAVLNTLSGSCILLNQLPAQRTSR